MVTIKQRGNSELGISPFYYVCTNPGELITNVPPINVSSKNSDSDLLNKPLLYANKGCLIDSGNLFNDIISRETAESLGLKFTPHSEKLHSANGKEINIIGRYSEMLYFIIPPIGRLFAIRPQVVEHLFTPIMLSVWFAKRFQARLDAHC